LKAYLAFRSAVDKLDELEKNFITMDDFLDDDQSVKPEKNRKLVDITNQDIKPSNKPSLRRSSRLSVKASVSIPTEKKEARRRKPSECDDDEEADSELDSDSESSTSSSPPRRKRSKRCTKSSESRAVLSGNEWIESFASVRATTMRAVYHSDTIELYLDDEKTPEAVILTETKNLLDAAFGVEATWLLDQDGYPCIGCMANPIHRFLLPDDTALKTSIAQWWDEDVGQLVRAHLNNNKVDANMSNLSWIPCHLNNYMRPLHPQVTDTGGIYVHPKMQGMCLNRKYKTQLCQ
jgi:hypothetical protein